MTSSQTPVSHDFWRGAGAAIAEGPTQVIPNGAGHNLQQQFGAPAPQWAGAPVPQPFQSAPPLWGPPMPPMPPMSPAPQWGVPTGPPRNSNTKWAIIASAVAVVATATAVTIAVTTGGSDDADNVASDTTTSTMVTAGASETSTAPTQDGDEEVPAPAPDSVLLSPTEAESAVGGSIVMKGEGAKLVDNSDTIDRVECVGAWGPLERESYTGSGYDEVAGQVLKDGNDESRLIIQGAVSFPSSADAKDYLADAEQSWQRCAGGTVIATSDEGKQSTWRFGSVDSAAGGLVTLSMTPDGAKGWGCERALGTSGAVVVDVVACGRIPTGDGLALAEAIVQKVEDESA